MFLCVEELLPLSFTCDSILATCWCLKFSHAFNICLKFTYSWYMLNTITWEKAIFTVFLKIMLQQLFCRQIVLNLVWISCLPPLNFQSFTTSLPITSHIQFRLRDNQYTAIPNFLILQLLISVNNLSCSLNNTAGTILSLCLKAYWI